MIEKKRQIDTEGRENNKITTTHGLRWSFIIYGSYYLHQYKQIPPLFDYLVFLDVDSMFNDDFKKVNSVQIMITIVGRRITFSVWICQLLLAFGYMRCWAA